MQTFLWLLEVFEEMLLLLFQPVSALVGRLFPNKILKQQAEVIIVFRWLSKNPLHYFWKGYLEKRGLPVAFVYYPMYKGSFRQSAQDLKKYIESNNLQNITLVGISSGGITCYSYLQEYGGWDTIKQFISIGSPFYGSPAAYFLSFLPYVRAITPRNVFLKELTKETLSHPEKVTCIAAKTDELVPRTSSILRGARKIVMPVIGHNNLHTTCRETYDLITHIAKSY